MWSTPDDFARYLITFSIFYHIKVSLSHRPISIWIDVDGYPLTLSSAVERNRTLFYSKFPVVLMVPVVGNKLTPYCTRKGEWNVRHVWILSSIIKKSRKSPGDRVDSNRARDRTRFRSRSRASADCHFRFSPFLPLLPETHRASTANRIESNHHSHTVYQRLCGGKKTLCTIDYSPFFRDGRSLGIFTSWTGYKGWGVAFIKYDKHKRERERKRVIIIIGRGALLFSS